MKIIKKKLQLGKQKHIRDIYIHITLHEGQNFIRYRISKDKLDQCFYRTFYSRYDIYIIDIFHGTIHVSPLAEYIKHDVISSSKLSV